MDCPTSQGYTRIQFERNIAWIGGENGEGGGNGIEIEYEIWGEENEQPLLLVGGLGAQLTKWSKTFREALVARNFKVVAYDNRDVGLSTKHDDWGPADTKAAFAQARAKQAVSAPYTLGDMAADAAGLLDALDIERTHVIGSSNGGAIAQIMATAFPGKIATMVSMTLNLASMLTPLVGSSKRRRLGLRANEMAISSNFLPPSGNTDTGRSI